MAVEFEGNRPIYQQIIERITNEIIRGEIKAGDKLTSVRDYAIEIGVNVNTIQRVYRELEYLDIAKSRRGQGTFVTEDKQRLDELKENMKKNLIQQFVSDMKDMGNSLDDMIDGIKREGGINND